MTQPVNFLSIDLEDWYHVYNLREAIPAEQWPALESRVERNTRRLLQVLEEHDTRATFFVLGLVAESHPNLIRKIHSAGHEIACHGYSHKMIYELTQQAFAQEIEKSCKMLQDITGQPVVGHRASNFSIIRETRWALDVLADHGIRYDSSIYPVKRRRYGIPDAPRRAHRMQTPSGRDMVEVPLSYVQVPGRRIPICGGGAFRLYPYWITRRYIRAMNRKGMPVVFYMHPWEIDTVQPRVKATLLKGFQHYVNLGKTETRLCNMIREFRFAGFTEILKKQALL